MLVRYAKVTLVRVRMQRYAKQAIMNRHLKMMVDSRRETEIESKWKSACSIESNQDALHSLPVRP